MVVADEQRVAAHAMSLDREPIARCNDAVTPPAAFRHPAARLHRDPTAFRDHRHEMVSRLRSQTVAGAQPSPA